MHIEGWIALGAGLIAIAALVVCVLLYRRTHTTQTARVTPPSPTPRTTGKVGFVINPTKPGVDELKETARRLCAQLAAGEPIFEYTTVEEPGGRQARTLLEQQVSTVVAAGGDGTVRAVAQEMAGTGVPMGLVPLGTANLLARNLDLPWQDTEETVRIAVAGPTAAVDAGRVRVMAPGGTITHENALFLVIGGLGFDAAMIDDTRDDLKERVKWLAYFTAGFRHLHSPRMRVVLTVDDGAPTVVRARTILVGNCGRLPAGLVLLPDARLDDGELDLARVDTRGGVIGWASLLGQVILQGLGLRQALPYTAGVIEHSRARTVDIRTAEPRKVQVDGDVLGPAVGLNVWVEPGALQMRVPGPAASGTDGSRVRSGQDHEA